MRHVVPAVGGVRAGDAEEGDYRGDGGQGVGARGRRAGGIWEEWIQAGGGGESDEYEAVLLGIITQNLNPFEVSRAIEELTREAHTRFDGLVSESLDVLLQQSGVGRDLFSVRDDERGGGRDGDRVWRAWVLDLDQRRREYVRFSLASLLAGPRWSVEVLPPSLWEYILFTSALLLEGHPSEIIEESLPVLLPVACSMLRIGGGEGISYAGREGCLAWIRNVDAISTAARTGSVPAHGGRPLMLDQGVVDAMRRRIWCDPRVFLALSSWSALEVGWDVAVDEAIEDLMVNNRGNPEGAAAMRAPLLGRCH